MLVYDINYLMNKNFEIDGLYSQHYEEFSMQPHRHSALEILYVESGKCEIGFHNVFEHTSVYVPILPYNFIIINSGVYHDLRIVRENGCTLKTVELRTSARPLAPQLPCTLLGTLLRYSLLLRTMIAEKQRYILLCDTVKLSRILTEIIYLHTQYQWDLPDDKYVLMQFKIGELILKINDCTPVNGNSNMGISYIKQSQQFIREHLMEPDLTPERVAQDIGITKCYLMTLFKKHMNQTILDVINSQRVIQARSKILNSEEHLIDIGFACGFNTRQSFYTNFKKYTGMSPSQFKANNTQISAYSYLNMRDEVLAGAE